MQQWDEDQAGPDARRIAKAITLQALPPECPEDAMINMALVLVRNWEGLSLEDRDSVIQDLLLIARRYRQQGRKLPAILVGIIRDIAVRENNRRHAAASRPSSQQHAEFHQNEVGLLGAEKTPG